MKNTQRGFVIPLLIIIAVLLGVGGGVYFNTQKNTKEVAVSADSGIVDDDKKGNLIPTKDITDNKLSDDAFTKALLDTGGKVIARGDVNGDGYEDAVTKVSTCGASCATDLKIVINNKNINVKVLDVSFDPGFKSSSAAKSDVINVSIKNGIISLTGYGLDCGGDLNQESDVCTQEKWSILKTIKFKLKSNNGASKYYLERVEKPMIETNKLQKKLLQICPETKVKNQMPTIEPNKNPPSVYFILNDQRRELNEFDLDWVEKNCVVKEDIVY